MSEFYAEMAEMAVDLLDPAELGQGTVELRRITSIPVDEEWMPPMQSSQTWPLKAVVTRLHQRFENGVSITETGDMVTFAVPIVRPLLSDTLIIDGAERAFTNLTPIPAAGEAALWKAWCKA